MSSYQLNGLKIILNRHERLSQWKLKKKTKNKQNQNQTKTNNRKPTKRRKIKKNPNLAQWDSRTWTGLCVLLKIWMEACEKMKHDLLRHLVCEKWEQFVYQGKERQEIQQEKYMWELMGWCKQSNRSHIPIASQPIIISFCSFPKIILVHFSTLPVASHILSNLHST